MRWKRNLTLVAVTLLLLLWLVSLRPEWVERIYSETVYPLLFAVLAGLTGWFPFSLAECLLLLAGLSLPAYLGWRGLQLVRKDPSRRSVVGRALQDLVLFGSFIAALGYGLWGLNYGRVPLSRRLDWQSPPTRPQELIPLLIPLVRQSVDLTNQAFRVCCSSQSIPSVPGVPLGELNSALNRGLGKAVRTLGLEAPSLTSNQVKPLIASEVMSYLGLAGFYFPWTGEANFNGDMLPLEAVHSMAHEKAHQIGFAREDEANFMGFLACLLSGNPYARYSGYAFSTRQLLALLRRVDREAWKESASALDPGVLQDQAAVREFWRPYEGPTQQMAQAVNNAHLRFNRVPGGILSYNRSVQLILELAASRGNSLEILN